MVEKITESRIVSLFLRDYSRRIYLREAADDLKKPHQSIKPYIESLVKKNILNETRRKNLLEFSLNFKNKAVYDYLIIAEKEKTQSFLQKHKKIKILYEKLNFYFEKDTFVIFGSSVDNPEKGRDIDLFHIGKSYIRDDINDFTEIYSKNIHLLSTKSLKDSNLTFIKEIYKKHIIFNNTETIIRFFGELHEKNKLV